MLDARLDDGDPYFYAMARISHIEAHIEADPSGLSELAAKEGKVVSKGSSLFANMPCAPSAAAGGSPVVRTSTSPVSALNRSALNARSNSTALSPAGRRTS